MLAILLSKGELCPALDKLHQTQPYFHGERLDSQQRFEILARRPGDRRLLFFRRGRFLPHPQRR